MTFPPVPPVSKHGAWPSKRTGTHRMVMQDRVPQARVYKVWNVPEWGTDEAIHLNLVSDVLGNTKTSRLYKRLVYDDEIATDASAFLFEREIGSLFVVSATAQPGQDLGAVETAMDEEMARFLEGGPTLDELERVQMAYRASFIRGVERIGRFGGKSDVLAMNEVYAGDPEFFNTRLARTATATRDDLRRVAVEWLSDGVFVLEVRPHEEGRTVASDVDRSELPVAGDAPGPVFPTIERATLPNGLEILLGRRDAVPVVNLQLMVDAGFASDVQSAPGTARLAMAMLEEGTRSRDALGLSDELQRLGATLSTGASLEASTVRMSALVENLDASLDLFADVILNPGFAESDFERLRRQTLAGIQQEAVQPFGMALRVLPKLMYGEGHPYSLPLTGSGTIESVSALTVDDLKRFHRTWFTPNNAKLIAVGDTTLEEVVSQVERAFGAWRRGDVPEQPLAHVEHQTGQSVYIMDRPDAIQSIIFAGHVAPPKSDPDDVAISTMNAVLGGDFTSRINMNLREDKHWSYGARTQLFGARGQRPFIVRAPVQSDKTTESVGEIAKELRGIVGARPVTPEELDQAVKSGALALPGSWETNRSVLASIAEMERYGLADDHFDTLADRINALTVAELNAAAQKVVKPGSLIWVIVGDKAQIEEGIRGLNLGPVVEIDADGNVL